LDREPVQEPLSPQSSQSASRQVPSLAEIAAFLVVTAAASIGIWLAVAYLPPIEGYPERFGPVGNWFGQDGLLLFVVPLFVGIYTAKRLFLRRLPASRSVMWYILIVIASLPYIWFFVVVDWYNYFIYRIACWIGYPIAIWAVPTCTFLIDKSASGGPTTRRYLIRSAIEIVLVIPVWAYFWAVFSFWILEWGWI
jgi:hypothetical protein